MAILELEALTRTFSSVVAVKELSFTVERGEIFALLGPNGAGKSTTIKMLTTLLKPSNGTARVDGVDIVRHPGGVRRIIGYVPQMLSADGTLSGRENLQVFARLYDIPRGERGRRVDEALAFMGLAEASERPVRQYSGGMIRRLEIAQSMLHGPRVLFLDEPTVGLDPAARRAVWEHVMELRDRIDATIILTTHQMEEADALCDRVAIMHQGRLVALGTPDELKATIDRRKATLEDVFIHYTGSNLDSGGNYRDTRSTRRSIRRLG
jgi:ABC-2 type transport system ATP-binding protein